MPSGLAMEQAFSFINFVLTITTLPQTASSFVETSHYLLNRVQYSHDKQQRTKCAKTFAGLAALILIMLVHSQGIKQTREIQESDREKFSWSETWLELVISDW